MMKWGLFGKIRPEEPEASKSALNVCYFIKAHLIPTKVVKMWHEWDETGANQEIVAEYTVKCGIHPVPAICELCWTGLCQSGEEYIWDGVNLLVYDQTSQEYHERKGIYYKPTGTSRIVFIKDEITKNWVTYPR